MIQDKKGKQRCFYLTKDLDDRLCEMARTEERSISSIVTIAVKRYLKAKEDYGQATTPQL